MANKKRAKRLLPSMLPDEEACERLAQIDIDRYGFGKVKYSGTREKPFYSTIGAEQFCAGQDIAERQFIETKLDRLHVGGSLTVIELEEGESKVEELMSLTKHVTEDIGLGFFTYDRKLTYCANCKKSWSGLLHKCPTCGATSTLTVYDRFTVS
jgi:anaerobic ribonucleoside-triphosphate reductase